MSSSQADLVSLPLDIPHAFPRSKATLRFATDAAGGLVNSSRQTHEGERGGGGRQRNNTDYGKY